MTEDDNPKLMCVDAASFFVHDNENRFYVPCLVAFLREAHASKEFRVVIVTAHPDHQTWQQRVHAGGVPYDQYAFLETLPVQSWDECASADVLISPSERAETSLWLNAHMQVHPEAVATPNAFYYFQKTYDDNALIAGMPKSLAYIQSHCALDAARRAVKLTTIFGENGAETLWQKILQSEPVRTLALALENAKSLWQNIPEPQDDLIEKLRLYFELAAVGGKRMEGELEAGRDLLRSRLDETAEGKKALGLNLLDPALLIIRESVAKAPRLQT